MNQAVMPFVQNDKLEPQPARVRGEGAHRLSRLLA